jgi:ADP-ribosylglycohydrolase
MNSKCQGALLGHLCGDAAGATLEFHTGNIHEQKAVNAMRMPGGGRWRVGPGQITDDGELTITLHRVLQTCSESFLPIHKVAEQYYEWLDSDPFDCGSTCGRAFSYSPDPAVMMNIARKHNMGSEANGALMRCSPIAIWGHRLDHSLHDIARNAHLDAVLSHPSTVCQDVNAIYCLVLSRILAGDVTLGIVDEYIATHRFNSKVVGWYNDAKRLTSLRDYECKKQEGHVRHAFTMAMFFASHGTSIDYEDGIKSVLMCGGDTDTNAAICGAVLGAIHGIEAIPEYMYKPVLSYKYDKGSLIGHDRPDLYSPKDLFLDLA